VDILQAIGKELDVEIEFEAMTWSEAIKAVQEGVFDAIQGMAISAKRRDLFEFSDEYLVVSHGIFVLRNRYNILGLEDLKGLKVAVQKEDISYELINDALEDKRMFLHYVFTNDQEEAFAALVNGKVDAYVGNRLTGTYFAQKLGQIDRVRLVGQPIAPQSYAIAVSRGRKSLVDLLNRGLKAIKENGKYHEIFEKWFGPMVRDLDNRIIDSVDVGVIGLNRLGVIISINAYARKLLNLKEYNLVGKYALETELVRYFNLGLIYETLSTGRGFLECEAPVKRDNGNLVIGYNICPLYGENGKISGVVINFRDITREKQLRESLARKDKMESLGLLLANIAHEIRNPITAIKAFVDALPKQYKNPKFRSEMFKYVPREIDRLNHLVEELIEYVRPRSPIRRPCNLFEIVRSVLVLCRGDAPPNVKIEVKVDKKLILYVDEQQIKQVLLNLVLNAIEAVGAQGCIEILADKEGDTVWIEVTDDGCGISEEQLSHIFDPFYTTKEQGTGLGLFIVYQLVKENGGDIRVFSQKNKGTTFRVEFRS